MEQRWQRVRTDSPIERPRRGYGRVICRIDACPPKERRDEVWCVCTVSLRGRSWFVVGTISIETGSASEYRPLREAQPSARLQTVLTVGIPTFFGF
jgi:hypothetical protein